MDELNDFRRDGFLLVPGLLDPARMARLLPIADGLRTSYLRRDPLTNKRGFLVSTWRVRLIDHPDFYAGAPDWWLPEILDLEADPAIRDVWRAETGEEPTFVYGALFMDPPMPHRADACLQAAAAPDGAGPWHRDAWEPLTDEVEKAVLLGDKEGRGDRHLLEIALLPSDAFEYIPGSHTRWDTPQELATRKYAETIAEQTRPLPGARRIHLEPGDALLVAGRGIHRGWYTYGVPRRTFTFVYRSMARLLRYPDDDERPYCFLEPEHFARLRPETRAYFAHQFEHCRPMARSSADTR